MERYEVAMKLVQVFLHIENIFIVLQRFHVKTCEITIEDTVRINTLRCSESGDTSKYTNIQDFSE